MPQTRFVEIGRVVLLNYGPDAGKLAVIIDVLDQARVFVHGPTTGVARQTVPTKRIALTKFKLPIARGIRSAGLIKAIKTADLQNKWNATSWAKKIALRKKRASSTDFERFQLTAARKTRATLVNAAFKKLLKTSPVATGNVTKAPTPKPVKAKPAAKPAAAKPAAAKGGKGGKK